MDEQDPHQFFSIKVRLTNRPVVNCSRLPGGLKYCLNVLGRAFRMVSPQISTGWSAMHKSRELTLVLILTVALIDALLIAGVRAHLIRGHGCEKRPGAPAVTRPALPFSAPPCPAAQ